MENDGLNLGPARSAIPDYTIGRDYIVLKTPHKTVEGLRGHFYDTKYDRFETLPSLAITAVILRVLDLMNYDEKYYQDCLFQGGYIANKSKAILFDLRGIRHDDGN